MDELSKNLTVLGKMMNAAALKTRVVANNLANVNSPGFTRSRVRFEQSLAEAVKRGELDSAKKLDPKVELDPGGKVKPDGNNVHMETEMADLVKSTIQYNVLNRILDGKIKAIRTAIQGH